MPRGPVCLFNQLKYVHVLAEKLGGGLRPASHALLNTGIKPLNEINLGVAQLYLTLKRNHLKWHRLDYQPLFGKGACASTPDSGLL